jgi:hypothetical protein
VGHFKQLIILETELNVWQAVLSKRIFFYVFYSRGVEIFVFTTGTCFIQKIYAPSSSLLQGKDLPFTPSPLRLNIFRLFVILSLTQLYRYTPEIFPFSTVTFKYKYSPPSEQCCHLYTR